MSEMPQWVRGWLAARAASDYQVWPEQEAGYRTLHARSGSKLSGYEWEAAVEREGVMPREDCLRYMQQAPELTSSQAVQAMTKDDWPGRFRKPKNV